MGANSTMVKSICEATGARINIPPLSLNKDEITIAGEKECVAKALSQVTKLHNELVSGPPTKTSEEQMCAGGDDGRAIRLTICECTGSSQEKN